MTSDLKVKRKHAVHQETLSYECETLSILMSSDTKTVLTCPLFLTYEPKKTENITSVEVIYNLKNSR